MKKLSLLVSGLLIAGASFAQTTTWTADKVHSKIGFSATHLVVSETEGVFKDYDIKVTSTKEDFDGADVEFAAKTASVFTDNEKRDGHLKSDDFFNAEKYPDLKFKGKLAKKGGKYVLAGDLTIRDVTKPITFDVVYGGTTAAFGGKAGFKLTGVVNRFDYNLKWDKSIEAGGDLIVGKEVQINCKVELNKSK